MGEDRDQNLTVEIHINRDKIILRKSGGRANDLSRIFEDLNVSDLKNYHIRMY